MLFKVYVVAHNHLVYGIQDIIMTYVWMELCYSSSIWSKIGSDKKALECFSADVPETSHLYRLVVRATAYSMLQPTAAHDHSNDRGAAGEACLDFHRPTNTKAQVEDFLRAVSDKVCRSIVETILSVKTLGCCKNFEDVVGTERGFQPKDHS